VILSTSRARRSDPIDFSTAKNRELIKELGRTKTIAIVPLNMQQAARVFGQRPPHVILEVDRIDEPTRYSPLTPGARAIATHPGLHHGGRRTRRPNQRSEKHRKAVDSDLQELTRLVAEENWAVSPNENAYRHSVDARIRRGPVALGQRVWRRPRNEIEACSA